MHEAAVPRLDAGQPLCRFSAYAVAGCVSDEPFAAARRAARGPAAIAALAAREDRAAMDGLALQHFALAAADRTIRMTAAAAAIAAAFRLRFGAGALGSVHVGRI